MFTLRAFLSNYVVEFFFSCIKKLLPENEQSSHPGQLWPWWYFVCDGMEHRLGFDGRLFHWSGSILRGQWGLLWCKRLKRQGIVLKSPSAHGATFKKKEEEKSKLLKKKKKQQPWKLTWPSSVDKVVLLVIDVTQQAANWGSGKWPLTNKCGPGSRYQ